MKKLILIQLLGVISIISACNIKPGIENDLYKISIPQGFEKNPHFIVTHKASQISREVLPQIYITFSPEKPSLVSSRVDGYSGVVGWKDTLNKVENNIFSLNGREVIASSVEQKNNQLIFTFPKTEFGEATLVVELPERNESPSFIMGINTAKEGSYSLGFTGLTPVSPGKLDFLYQPLV